MTFVLGKFCGWKLEDLCGVFIGIFVVSRARQQLKKNKKGKKKEKIAVANLLCVRFSTKTGHIKTILQYCPNILKLSLLLHYIFVIAIMFTYSRLKFTISYT